MFAEKGDDIAAVLLEPIMKLWEYFSNTRMDGVLRKTCTDYGTMLVIDEVKTGFRVAKGGAQELYGVYADLTPSAKAMGNGYPVACFGGRAEVMDVIGAGGGVVHGGTYTANLVALSAAHGTLDVLANTDALKTVDRVGAEIRDVLGRVFTAFGIEHRFAGPPSMFGIHFGDHVPTNRDWKVTSSGLYVAFWQLIRHGVMVEPDSREPWFICEAHQDVDLQWLEDVAMESMRLAVESMVE